VAEIEEMLERARTGKGDALTELLSHSEPPILMALLQNPALDEHQSCLLLARRDLPAEVLEQVGTQKHLLKHYEVKKALLFHPRAPRLVSLRLLKDLYLLDLVQFTLSPSAAVEIKRQAEAQIISRMPQLPLGQKIVLARRGPGRVAGALVAEGHPQLLRLALDNPHLTEAHVLKALAGEKVPVPVVQALCGHAKWSQLYNVRLALVRNPSAPLAAILAFLPQLTVNDLRELASPGIVPENLRNYLQAEVLRRMHASKNHPSLKT
jgi:hypothetical protein